MTKTNDVTDSGMRLEIDRLLNGHPLEELVTLVGGETTSEVLQYVRNAIEYRMAQR
jgi:hypothetical protein